MGAALRSPTCEPLPREPERERKKTSRFFLSIGAKIKTVREKKNSRFFKTSGFQKLEFFENSNFSKTGDIGKPVIWGPWDPPGVPKGPRGPRGPPRGPHNDFLRRKNSSALARLSFFRVSRLLKISKKIP